MKKFLSILAVAAAVGGLLYAIGGFEPAESATPNVTPAAGQVVVLPFLIAGQRTASQADIVEFTMPFEANLLGITAHARASGGTTPTLTITAQEGAGALCASPIAVTAGAVSECSVSDALIADEGSITFDTTIGGGSPTWDDITIVMTVVRR